MGFTDTVLILGNVLNKGIWLNWSLILATQTQKILADTVSAQVYIG